MNVVGLMSGTSADGIDAVVVSLRGAPPRLEWQLLAHVAVPFSDALRERIFAAFRPETGPVDRLCRLNFDLGEAFADAALAAIDAAKLKPDDVALIGSHGQTVWHEPPTPDQPGATLQIGSAAVKAVGVPVYTHTCGRIGDRLELMAETGTDGIDTLDPPPLGNVELAEAKRRIGDRLFIKGNMNSVALLAYQTKEQVIAEAAERIRIGMPGGGYILSTACSVSPHVEPWKLELLAPLAEKMRYSNDA